MEYNKDQAVRDHILGLTDLTYLGGTERFHKLPLNRLILLAELHFVDFKETQNDSPTIADFIKFMTKYPETTAHGYVVSLRRDDYRLTIEGLEYDGPVSKQMHEDFYELCNDADNGIIASNRLYSWWD